MSAESEIDAALLASIGFTWTKVAMVLARASKLPGLVFESRNEEFSELAARLEKLVASEAVVARGDLKQWRESEVRLAGIDLDEVQRDLKRLVDKLSGGNDGPNRA